MHILAISEIQGNCQITIPEKIIENFGIDDDTVVEWIINEKGNLELNFRNN